MKTYTLTFAQSVGFTHPHPERTARQAHGGFNLDFTFKVWPSRAALAKSIRMQQMREAHFNDWQPIIPLSAGEGY